MLQQGDTIPDATIWTEPHKPASVRDLIADGPILLLFYLFDWSST
jgi:peroxiredoxin